VTRSTACRLNSAARPPGRTGTAGRLRRRARPPAPRLLSAHRRPDRFLRPPRQRGARLRRHGPGRGLYPDR
jgi:hypothetical protein